MKRTLAVLALAACAAAHAGTIRGEGEVVARQSASIAPPAVEDLYMLSITQMLPDGAPVKKGDVVASFDGGQLSSRLEEKQGKLKEKQTELAQLLLDIAERERASQLAVGQARSDLEKAQRKASQPKSLIAGRDYQLLVIALDQSRQKLDLQVEHARLEAEQRAQERRLLESEVAQLRGDVTSLTEAMASLAVTAPRAGVMSHESNWKGEKIDVGAQAWRGQTIARIPDMGSLQVRADIAERDFAQVRVGQPARVRMEGGLGSTLRGRVAEIGSIIHSKSRVEPVPVVSVTIALTEGNASLRPGQPVSVEIEAGAAGAR